MIQGRIPILTTMITNLTRRQQLNNINFDFTKSRWNRDMPEGFRERRKMLVTLKSWQNML